MSWPQVKLASIFEIARGGSPRPIDDYITDVDDGLNWISIKDASNSGKYIYETKLRIKPEGLSRTRMVRPGDFILTNSMSFGRPYIMKTTGCIHDGWLVLSGDSNRVDTDYFYHLFGSDLLKRRFSSLAAGAVVKNLNIDLVKGVEVPLPPLSEQKRIAAILDRADAIRRKRQKAIQLADDFLRAVFLDMFGDVIESAENIVSFSDIAVLDAPMVDPRGEEYIDLIHIGPDRIQKNSGKLLPALTAREEGLISGKFLFDDRYVLYSKIRPHLRKCAVAEGIGLCSADMYPVRPVEGVATREFLWMLLLSDFFTAYTESLPARANIPKLNRGELEKFTLSLPDYSQQLEFSSIVRSAKIASRRVAENAAYVDSAFGSLSQKAFSGQL